MIRFLWHTLTDVWQAHTARRRRDAFTLRHRQDIYQIVARDLDSGEDFARILRQLHRIASRQGRSPDHPQAQALESWLLNADTAKPADVVKDWVPPFETMLIAAGFESGRLADAFRGLDRILDAIQDLERALANATFQWRLTFVGILMLAYGYGWFVLPTIEDIVQGRPLPPRSAAYAATLHAFHDWAPWLLLILPGTLRFISWTLDHWTGRLRVWADDFYPWSMHRNRTTAIFVMSVALLARAGTDPKDALRKILPYAAPYEAERIRAIWHRMNGGLGFGAACDAAGLRWPHPDVADRLIYATSRGEIAGPLTRVGDDLVRNLVVEAEHLGRRIEKWAPLLIFAVILVITLGFIDLQRAATQYLF